jgi:membrane protein YdbS with pleckstrin-like domain
MSKPVAYLIVAIVFLSILVSAGPTLVALANAAVPLVMVVGSVAIALRLVWYFTNRY